MVFPIVSGQYALAAFVGMVPGRKRACPTIYGTFVGRLGVLEWQEGRRKHNEREQVALLALALEDFRLARCVSQRSSHCAVRVERVRDRVRP